MNFIYFIKYIFLKILFIKVFIILYILIDKCVRRSSLPKNAKKYNRFRNELHLDRGDFYIHVSGVQQTDWIPCEQFCSRRRVKRDKNRRSIFFKRGTARLRCTEGTFRVHNIYGDGNCMFRAISYILWRNEDEHRYLRSMVVQHIKENWHEYGPFVIAEWNISDRQTYDNYMSMVGTFASELECTVATKLYDMNLSIYREINDRHELKRVFYNHVSSHFETARLLFTGNSDSGHYDVLVPD
ncbi:uncharacterized protein LOC100867834 [Apis florea]|uniref:uncharacterized protein LOC100867834 n=1 Tax=Apis florea TaxID=7463 RepID=UPI0012FECAC0|nr:uncharacterized protein LOC100867834 [Apis florea]